MAGDWIKMRSNLHEHPKVLTIADTLGMDAFGVVGRLHRLWSWVDQHSENGRALVAHLSRVDDITCATGFAQALKSVGWLEGEDGDLSFPRYEEHNGQTAKKRAENTLRQKMRRSGVSRGCRASVAQTARPEKRREEKKSKTPHSPPTGGRVQTSPEFDAWWRSYPVRGNPGKRGDKQAAWDLWQRLTDQQREKVPKATARLIASGQLPKDAERFLRPPRGGKTPEFETWLEDTTAAPVAGTGKSAVQRKEAQNHDEDYAWLTESK